MLKKSDIKLVVADLDGTLLDSHKVLDSKIKDVLLNQDFKFTIASGRSMVLVKGFVEELHIDMPYITNNGAEIFKGNECIQEYSIPKDEVHTILSLIQDYGFECHANAYDCIYTMGKIDLIRPFRNRFEGVLPIVDHAKIEEIVQNKINKMMCIDQNLSLLEKFQREVNKICEHAWCERAEGNAFVIVNKEASKGKALEQLMSLYHLNRNEVVVFGDNYNDTSMFDVVDYSVCMANADEDIKQMATFVCGSNDENGVSNFLKEFLCK